MNRQRFESTHRAFSTGKVLTVLVALGLFVSLSACDTLSAVSGFLPMRV